ncbi:MAG: ferritin family protein [Betaproteobacteria bacterium]
MSPATKKRPAAIKAKLTPIAKKKAGKPAAKTAAPKKPPPKPAASKPATARPAAVKPAAAKPVSRWPAATAPRSLAEFMTQAWVMENEAAQRYHDFADAMETHNNREVASMFRTMAQYEAKHADQILDEMGWTSAPQVPAGGFRWEGLEAPETTPIDEVHYLMQPYHALQLALAAEERAERFFAALVKAAGNESIRRAARELQAEEREHVELVKAWMKKVPKPDRDWANDPDPPVYTD